MAIDKDIPIPSWLTAIIKLGIPGAIAVFLVWRLAAGFDVFAVRMEKLEMQSATQHSEIKTHGERIEDLTGRAYMLNEKMLMVLRTMCVNDARTADARRNCVAD